jgi:hypothetical protein
VRVPDEAGDGKATVKLSFPDWKQRSVRAAEFQITLSPTTKADRKVAEKKSQNGK